MSFTPSLVWCSTVAARNIFVLWMCTEMTTICHLDKPNKSILAWMSIAQCLTSIRFRWIAWNKFECNGTSHHHQHQQQHQHRLSVIYGVLQSNTSKFYQYDRLLRPHHISIDRSIDWHLKCMLSICKTMLNAILSILCLRCVCFHLHHIPLAQHSTIEVDDRKR